MLSEQCPPHNYDVDGICYGCGEDFTTYVAQLEAENATIKLWGFKPEASALTLGEAITELQDKLHGAVKENQRLREIETAALTLFADTIEFYKKPYNKPKGPHLEFSRRKHGDDLWRLWKALENAI